MPVPLVSSSLCPVRRCAAGTFCTASTSNCSSSVRREDRPLRVRCRAALPCWPSIRVCRIARPTCRRRRRRRRPVAPICAEGPARRLAPAPPTRLPPIVRKALIRLIYWGATAASLLGAKLAPDRRRSVGTRAACAIDAAPSGKRPLRLRLPTTTTRAATGRKSIASNRPTTAWSSTWKRSTVQRTVRPPIRRRRRFRRLSATQQRLASLPIMRRRFSRITI